MAKTVVYKMPEEIHCTGVVLDQCLTCPKASVCMLLHEQLSLFGALDVDEVTEIFEPKELKREEELAKKKALPIKPKKRKKIVDHSWDYVGANTKKYTHRFHNYPAMMISQIASRLLDMYAKEDSGILDPFCGSGTVLVEAKLRGLKSYGIDINPLALLLAEVKTTPISLSTLQKVTTDLLNNIRKSSLKDIPTPNFFNIEYWFKPLVIKKLSIIKREIDKIKTRKLKNFFLVAFSETARDVSNTRNSEFKLYRLPNGTLENFNPDVFQVFEAKVNRNTKGMRDYLEKVRGKEKTPAIILDEDTRYKTSIPDQSVDVVVTSPPYGDSKTTVAYGQFSRLSLQWLGFSGEDLATDTISLGGKDLSSSLSYYSFNSPLLKQVLFSIAEKSKTRARDVFRFFLDLKQCFKEIGRVLAPKGFICMVVGNRTVKGIQIPTDEIICEMGEELDLKHIQTIVRNIPGKRMPSRTSPTNVPGVTGPTMLNEYIVIMRKE